MNKHILTIGIPTYNGEKTIVKALDSIISQIVENDLPIDIIISDNGSIDCTYKTCLEIADKFPFIKVYKNERNLGYDRNVDALVKRCDAKYIWLFSDNEVLSDSNALVKVYYILAHNNVDYLYIENRLLNRSYESNHIFVSGGNRFFELTKFKSGLITSNIVNVALWKSINISKYFDCEWIHFAYQIEVLSPDKNNEALCCIIHDRLFEGQNDTVCNWGKGGRFLLVGIQLEELFLELNKLGYNDNVIRYAKKVIRNGYPLTIVRARLDGLSINSGTLKRMKTVYGQSFLYSMDYFYSICPINLCKISYPFLELFDKILRKVNEQFRKNT